MENGFEVRSMIKHKPVWARAYRIGSDWNVFICGGDTPHIGACSIASFENGKFENASVELPGHKDAQISESAAAKFARALCCNVSVSCGIHFDEFSETDIYDVLSESSVLIDELIKYIQKQSVA